MASCIRVLTPPIELNNDGTYNANPLDVCIENDRIATYLLPLITNTICLHCIAKGPPPCNCNVAVCACDCDGAGAVTGVTFTLDGRPPDVPNFPAGTGCGNWALCDHGGEGSYQVTANKAGYTSYSNRITFKCGQYKFVKLQKIPKSGFQVAVDGCCGLPLPGATLTIAGQTVMTNSAGDAGVTFTDAGSYPWTVSKDRFITQSGTYIATQCGTAGEASLTLLPASGFHCAPAASHVVGHPTLLTIADPIPNTLTLSDVYGDTTLTYDVGTASWIGSITVSIVGRCFCQTRLVKINYSYGPSCIGGGASAFARTLNDGGCACQCPCDPISDPTHCSTLLPGTGGPSGTITETLALTVPLMYSITGTASICTNGVQFGYDYLYPGGGTLTITE